MTCVLFLYSWFVGPCLFCFSIVEKIVAWFFEINGFVYTFASLLKNKANEGELVAQQVEHIPFKDGVLGSSPNWLTKAVKSFLAAFFMAIGAVGR